MKKNIIFKSILIALCLICYQLINSTNAIAYDIPFINSNKSSAILKIDDPILAPGKSFLKKFKIQNDLDYNNELEAVYLDNFLVNSFNKGQYNQFVDNISLELIYDDTTIFKETLRNIIKKDGKVIFEDNKNILFKKDEIKEFCLVVSMDWNADNRVEGLIGNFDLYFMCSEVYVSPSTKKYNSPGTNKIDEKPVLTLKGDTVINLDVGEEYLDKGATAYDKEDGDITSNIEVRVNGILNGKIDTKVEGKYLITYNVSDSEGNSADEIKREVNIVNNISIDDSDESKSEDINEDDKNDDNGNKPIITLIGKEKIEIFEGEEYVDMGAKALDEEDGDISEKIIVKVNGVVGEVDVKIPGQYIITYNVSDSNGNKADEVSRIVIVKPKEVIKIIDELPKTGERDPLIFYIIGLGIVAIGLFVRRKHLTK